MFCTAENAAFGIGQSVLQKSYMDSGEMAEDDEGERCSVQIGGISGRTPVLLQIFALNPGDGSIGQHLSDFRVEAHNELLVAASLGEPHHSSWVVD